LIVIFKADNILVKALVSASDLAPACFNLDAIDEEVIARVALNFNESAIAVWDFGNDAITKKVFAFLPRASGQLVLVLVLVLFSLTFFLFSISAV